MTPKRIMMIAPTPYFADRGCHVRIYEEARALQSRGHSVLIVTYHLGRDMGDIPVLRIPKIPWYRKLSAGPSWHKLYLDIFLLFKSLVAAQGFKPDIIHAHLHEGAFLAALAKRSFKTPILFDCQGSLTGELLDHGFVKKGRLRYRLFAKLEEWITRQVDHVVTSSTPTADLIRRDFPEVASRVTPLVDAVDTNLFRPMGKDSELLQSLDITSGRKLIVYLGAMTKYQGVDLLLEAMQQLVQHRDDVHLLLMGYPHEQYRTKVQRMGLADHVSLTGKIDYEKAPCNLSLGDIAVSPKLSATEANGKLMNYLACGLPCVVFDTPINRELLGDLGLYVEQQDAVALSDALAGLLDDETRRQDLAARSRQAALEKHAWSARIEVLECVYKNMTTPPK